MTNASYEHNMLFGLIAHQVGFVDQMTLVKALRRWATGRNISIGQQFVDQGFVDVAECGLIESLALKHLARHGAEMTLSFHSFQSYESVCDQLRKIDDPAVQELLSTIAHSVVEHEAGSTSEAVRSQLSFQRYKAEREHASGGLGKVWLAKDNELHRWVALKSIKDAWADDPRTRQRFEFEAEVTGNLEHPSIVAVYGLITDKVGRPQYAMRLIRGLDLRAVLYLHHKRRDYHQAIDLIYQGMTRKEAELEVIAGGRKITEEAWIRERRGLLTKFVAACDALDYAHDRKVLHRDLKPSNFMIGKHGEILVVDWGLAKTADPRGHVQTPTEDLAGRTYYPSSGGSEVETHAHDMVGTPDYMSPEQANHEHDTLGPATDIYSLGATLFTILTGRTPTTVPSILITDHEKRNFILNSTRAGTFDRPREVVPSVPRPLEAIVLNAMALKPEDRYPSAAALARDIERWLADEPVSVDVEPWLERLARWGRKNRTIVAAAAMLLMTGTASLGIGYYLLANEKARVTREQAQTEKALNLAIETVDRTLSHLADNGMYNIPELSELRRRIAIDAQEQFEGLSRINPKKWDLKVSRVHIYKILGNIERGTGHFAASEIAYASALALLAIDAPINKRNLIDYAILTETMRERAEGRRMAGDPKAAITGQREAIALVDRLILVDPSNPSLMELRGTIQGEMSDSLSELNEFVQAKTEVESAILALNTAAKQEISGTPETRLGRTLNLTLFHVLAAKFNRIENQIDDSIQHREAAETSAIEVIEKLGNRNDASYLLALCHHEEASLLVSQQKPAEAQVPFGKAIRELERFRKLYPSLIEYPRVLAIAFEDRGASLATMGKTELADADYTKSEALLTGLLERNPDHNGFREQLRKLRTYRGAIKDK